MSAARRTDVNWGGREYTVSTEVHLGDPTFIETVVALGGHVVSRWTEDTRTLGPVFKNAEEVRRRVEAQHDTVVERLKRGELPMTSSSSPLSPEEQLQNALANIAGGSYDEATDDLREVLRMDPDFTEARELLEIAYAARSGEKPTALSATERVKAGAEAFAEGQKWRALEHWRAGILAEPASRLFHLLVLIASGGASSGAAQRRKRYIDELLNLGQKYLSQNAASEAYALFLVAQSAEAMAQNERDTDPTGASSWKQESPSSPTLHVPPPRAREPESVEDVAAPAHPLEPLPAFPKEPSPEQTLYGEPPLPTSPATKEVPPVSTERSAALYEAPPATRSQLGVSSTRVGSRTLSGGRTAGTLSGTRRTSGPDKAEGLPGRTPEERRPAPARDRSEMPRVLRYVLVGVVVAAVLGIGIWLAIGRSSAPGTPNGLLEADRLLTAGRYAEAVSAYSSVIEKQEGVSAAHLGRGRARLAAGDVDEGLLDLERAADLSQDPSVSEELANALFDRARFDGAAPRYTNVIAQGHDTPEIRFRLAASFYALGRISEALPHVEAALKQNPELAEARFLYARVLNAQQRYADAERELLKVREQLTPRGDLYAELGTALLEQGKVEPAETVAREFVRFDDRDGRSHQLLGEVFLRKQQYEPARDEFIQALRANRNDARARIALGRVWLAMGDARKAREALTEPTSTNEGERLLVLGQVSLADGRADEAISLVEQATRSGAPPLAAHIVLARARYVSKDLTGAATDLEAAAKLAPGDPAIPLSLGFVLAELKEPSRASEQFVEALRGAGLTAPAAGTGPVMLKAPYVPLPSRFDVTRLFRTTYRQALAANPEDASALALKTLAEATSFAIAES